MPVKTTEQQLIEVQTAITALLTGAQSYSIDGRSVTRASLDSLQKREQYLKTQYARETGGRPRVSYADLSSAFVDSTSEDEES